MAAKETTEKSKKLQDLEVRKLENVKRQRELKLEEAKINAELVRAGGDRILVQYW